jgi:hypothetical protein
VEDTRSYISGNVITLAAADSIKFERDALHYCARSGATTTAVSCPAYTALPVGLRFTLDNSNGSGSMTVTPITGTAIVVPTLKVYDCLVSAAGSIKAGELAAAPT